ncbi:type II toxin-antitoxin system HicA family toxin [Wenzhouxiangella sp. 15190]|uniref:type II toxin-antitoxin system HicA family toxin n=1 Tax=unclassified Wenzhouxiangella TaxID=2613841 RepID=UPI001C6F3840
MKLPRDVSGDELTARLGDLGYKPTWQTGSHVRLTRHSKDGAQHTTIPRHSNLKIRHPERHSPRSFGAARN